MWGRVGDVITESKFYENQLRGVGVTGLPKRHFLYLAFIALTTVLAQPCCTVMSLHNVTASKIYMHYNTM